MCNENNEKYRNAKLSRFKRSPLAILSPLAETILIIPDPDIHFQCQFPSLFLAPALDYRLWSQRGSHGQTDDSEFRVGHKPSSGYSTEAVSLASSVRLHKAFRSTHCYINKLKKKYYLLEIPIRSSLWYVSVYQLVQ